MTTATAPGTRLGPRTLAGSEVDKTMIDDPPEWGRTWPRRNPAAPQAGGAFEWVGALGNRHSPVGTAIKMSRWRGL